MCSHSYSRPVGDYYVCYSCGEIFKKTKPHMMVAEMPPVIYRLDRSIWKDITPWPNISYEVANRYGWYITVIRNDDYLVMPVFEKKNPIFYSARRLTDNGGLKYMTPKGVQKRIWKSKDRLKSPILLAEGIADAAYLSQLSDSVAVLGSYGDIAFPVIIMFDADTHGIDAAFRLLEKQQKNGIFGSKVVILPDGGDPTDYSLPDLRKIIKERVGVLL